MTKKFAVIGNPISHSKSPLIHQAFANQFDIAIDYETVLAPLDSFKATVNALIAKGYQGVNVTVPFKTEAHDLCDEKTESATAAGTVNTLSFSNGKIIGDNTDGSGLVFDITSNLQQAIRDKRVLLIGAGGAAEGVLLPLMKQQPAALVIVNRSVEKAERLANKLNNDIVQVRSFERLEKMPFDIIINATSAGISNAALPLTDAIFKTSTLAYDMMYGKQTLFMQQAADAGATVVDGLGMLIEQAADAFLVWHQQRPDTQLVMADFRHG